MKWLSGNRCTIFSDYFIKVLFPGTLIQIISYVFLPVKAVSVSAGLYLSNGFYLAEASDSRRSSE